MSTASLEKLLAQDLPQHPPQQWKQLTPQCLQAALQRMSVNSATGMDKSAVEHLRPLDSEMIPCFAYFFTECEKTGHWPHLMRRQK
eukprot:5584328-Amphidinium_carterae.1